MSAGRRGRSERLLRGVSPRVGSAFLADGGQLVLADGGGERRERCFTHDALLVRARADEAKDWGVDDVAYVGLGARDRARA